MTTADVLYIPDLARRLGRTEAAIRSAHQRGQIPGAFMLLGRVAWRTTDIEAWIAAQGQTETTAPKRRRGRPRKDYDQDISLVSRPRIPH